MRASCIRTAGIGGALIPGTAFLIYGAAAIRASHSSTAAIGCLLVPFEVAVVMMIGYLAGLAKIST